MNLRAAIFWGRDLLTGGRARAELAEVKFLNSRSSQATKRRLLLLEHHLAYVNTYVPYYRDQGVFSNLCDFPVLNKNEIQSMASSMIADGAERSKLHVATTSGSTGTPFKVYQDHDKRKRADAELIYMGQLAGYAIGNPLWYFKLWTRRSSYSKPVAFARNMRPIDVSKFNETDALQILRKTRRAKQSISIIAHSSVLETMARALQRTNQDVIKPGTLDAIVGQAESLSQPAREILWEKTGVFPVGRYGMQELGILAQQGQRQEETYLLNLASYIVEVLKLDSDERASAGELGRVVVTDLFNKAQPLVRYDTGDLAVVAVFEEGTGYAESLERLEGRSRDQLYDVDDQPISPLITYNFWWKFSGIHQYQIVQRKRGHYVMRLEVSNVFDHEEELVNELRKVVGSRADISIEYATEDFQYASGKRQTIVSEYTPSVGDL